MHRLSHHKILISVGTFCEWDLMWSMVTIGLLNYFCRAIGNTDVYFACIYSHRAANGCSSPLAIGDMHRFAQHKHHFSSIQGCLGAVFAPIPQAVNRCIDSVQSYAKKRPVHNRPSLLILLRSIWQDWPYLLPKTRYIGSSEVAWRTWALSKAAKPNA